MEFGVQPDDKQELRKIQFAETDFVKARQTLMRRVCVQVARKEGAVAVRDSKDESRTTLLFSNEEWKVFVEGVKAGEFDV